jgi:hypothetical protein
VSVRVPILHRPGVFALVDDEDAPRVLRYQWRLNTDGIPVRRFAVAGRDRKESLPRFLLAPPKGVVVRFRNKNRLDCRRENLTTPMVSRWVLPDGRVRVVASIDNRTFCCGRWPRVFAPEVMELAGQAAARLRGRGLSRYEIRRELLIAVGRHIPTGADL